MFDKRKWLIDSLIRGVENGTFTAEYVAKVTVDYARENYFTDEQAEQIHDALSPPEDE